MGNAEEGRYASNVVLRLLTLPHRGKGAALNAAVAAASHSILVTVDADTVVAPGALRALVAAFDDESVVSATGSVLVSSAPNLLTRFQQIEFVRNTLIRTAWARLGALEQLPGAFSSVRAERLRAVGGFPTDSMTEDYEVTYRLYDEAARDGRSMKVVVVPTACAYTEAPTTLRALGRQRTRWFGGFLVTLYRFSAPDWAGARGGVRLGEASDQAPRRGAPAARALLALGGVSYFWVRQAVVLRAYGWALFPNRRKASWGEVASEP